MAEFNTMQTLAIRVQDRAREIRSLKDEVPKLKAQLSETKGIFKSKERKALEIKIQQTVEIIYAMLEAIPDVIKSEDYPDVQSFMTTYLTENCPNGNARSKKAADPPKKTICIAPKSKCPSPAQTVTGTGQRTQAPIPQKRIIALILKIMPQGSAPALQYYIHFDRETPYKILLH